MANITRTQLDTLSLANFPNNNSQLISPQDLRDWLESGVDSFVTQKDKSTFENAFYEAKGSPVTAASTTSLSNATGNFLHIVGTNGTQIDSFGTCSAGARFVLYFEISVILNHNATSLIIPGGNDITTTAGDAVMLISEGSGNWRLISYFPGTGLPVGTVTAVTASAPLSATPGNAPNLSIPQSNGSTDGFLDSADWTTFNGKQDALTLTTTGTSGAATLTGATLNIPQYSGGTGGITALTGDVTASGTGSVAATIANSAVDIPMLSATGTPSATTFLRGDNVWATPAGASPTGYYAMYQDLFTQTAAVNNTGYPMKFRTMDLSNQVTVVSDSRITFTNAGIYNLQFSSQFQNTDNAQHDITIWLRLNGTDVSGSAGFVQIPARKGAGAGNEGHLITSWNYLLDVAAGQYYEIVWSTTNAANVTMQFYAAGSPPPSTASTIFTVTQQAGIMAGTGITGMVGTTGPTQAGATQTLAVGTSGTDFTIASSSNTHTFNIPDASATARGLITTGNQILSGIKTFANGVSAGEIRLKEDTANGSNYVAIKSPSALASDLSFTLPNADGSNGQVIQTNGSGVLSWVANGGRPYLTNITSNTVTGLTEQLLVSLLIPANTYGADSHIQFNGRFTRPASSGQTTIKFYLNTSAVIGGTNFGSFQLGSGSNTSFRMMRSMSIINATTTTNYNAVGNTVGSDFGAGTDTNAAINWTIDQYFVVSAQSNSATGSNTSRAIIISQM